MNRCFLFVLIISFHYVNAYSEKNVLLINSYHPGFTWTDGITEGVTEAFSARADINLYVEYEDAKRFADTVSMISFKDYLTKKYSQKTIDLIITSDNNALDFIIHYEFDKKWNVPLVFCGISNYQDYNINNNNYYGVLETDDWLPIVNSILNIQKNKLDTFYFISENSSTGIIRDNLLRECFNNGVIKTRLVLLSNYTSASLIRHVSHLRGNSIVYYHGVGVDSYGNPVIPEILGTELAKMSVLPVYTSYPGVIGAGAVGGFVRSGRIHGLETAQLALKLLDGEDKRHIPRISVQGGIYLFDFKIIEKYNLDIHDFPKGSVFINKPKKLFETHKYESIAVLTFIIILLIIITFLIISNYRRNKAEKRYKESESRFREFAELLPQIVFETDLNGRILFVNNHAFDKFGYTRDDINAGIILTDIIINEDIEKMNSIIRKLIRKEKITDSTYTVTDRYGRKYIYEVHPNLILKDGKPFGIRGIGIDVTNKKQFEQELIEARKKAEESDRLKSAFLANMSHEIRTPLNSIVGFSYLLSERSLNDEEIKRMSKYIRTSSDHLLMLINDVIDISKIEAGQLEINRKAVNVPELLSELNLYIEREKERCEKNNIEIIFKNSGDQDGHIIHTDVIRLRQILYNLINNAIKFTENGFIEFGYYNENGNIVFYVKDSGIGVSKDLGDRIFNRFVKLNSSDGKLYPGFGLGLSISRQLSEMLGGRLWYILNKEAGTTFYLSLPGNHD